MEIKISDYATKELLHARKYPYNFEVIKDIDEIDSEIKGDYYQIKINEKWFEGIHISVIEFETQRPTLFSYCSASENIGLVYLIAGTLNYYDEGDVNRIHSIVTRQQQITKGQLHNTIINIDGRVKYLHIQLTQSYYRRIADTDFDSSLTSTSTFVEPEMELLLQAIINSRYTGRANRLFIESKIFELIVFFINQKNGATTSMIKKEDVEKILMAKLLVESNIQKPNSLVELSRKVGINDYKLKKGFKEITGYTVFGYLYKIRMEQAHHYLATDKKTVNEVSYLVGYKNPQHFITAFKKLYKILPGSLNKSINSI